MGNDNLILCDVSDGENNGCIPPTLEGWVYIIPIHGPLDGPLYTWAQYTPTFSTINMLAENQVIPQKSYCYYSLTFSTQMIWDHRIRKKVLI